MSQSKQHAARKGIQTPGFKANVAAIKRKIWNTVGPNSSRAVRPPSRAEADAAIARYLATKTVTICPPRAAESINGGDGFGR